MKIIFFLIYSLTRRKLINLWTFHCPKNDFKRGDWYSEVRNILEEYEINMTDEEIQAKPDSLFKELVKEKNVFGCFKVFENEAK